MKFNFLRFISLLNLLLLIISFTVIYFDLQTKIRKTQEIVVPDFTPLTIKISYWGMIGILSAILGLFLKPSFSKYLYYILLIVNVLYFIQLALNLINLVIN